MNNTTTPISFTGIRKQYPTIPYDILKKYVDEGMTIAEIAKSTNMSCGAVAYRLSKLELITVRAKSATKIKADMRKQKKIEELNPITKKEPIEIFNDSAEHLKTMLKDTNELTKILYKENDLLRKIIEKFNIPVEKISNKLK